MSSASGAGAGVTPASSSKQNRLERLFYETLSDAAGFESKDKDGVAMQLLAQMPVLRDRLAQGLVSHCHHMAEVALGKRNHTISIVLSDMEKTELKKLFPQYTIEFLSRIRHEHGFSAAVRDLDERSILDSFGSSQPADGYQYLVKDIGGNPGRHLSNGRLNVHTCFPCLSASDAVRQTRFLTKMASFQPKSYNRDTLQMYNMMLSKGALCSLRAEECSVTAPYIMSVHSAYDISRDSLAEAMIRSNARLLRGTMIFHPDVCVFDHGVIPFQNMYFQRFKKNAESYIRFYFPNGGSLDYVHRYESYMEILKTIGFSYKQNNFSIEIDEIGGGRMVFTIYRHYLGPIPACTEHRTLALGHDDKVVVYYWRARNPSLMSSLFPLFRGGDVVRVRLVVSKRLFDKLYSYATTLSEGKFVPQSIINAGHAFNQRVVISGSTVAERDTWLTSADIVTLSYAIYLKVYMQRYVESRTMTMIKAEIDRMRLDRNVFSRLYSFVTSPLWNVHAFDDIPRDTLTLETVESGCWSFDLTTEKLPILAEYLPLVMTVSEDIEFTGVTSTIHRLTAIDDDDVFPRAPAPPDEACTGDFTICPVTADGNCFFHALRIAGITSLSPADIRRKLLAEFNKWSLEPAIANEQRYRLSYFESNPPPAHWADEVTFKLSADVFKVRLCVHLTATVRQYGTGKMYHFLLSNEHVSLLKPKLSLPSCLLVATDVSRKMVVPDLSEYKKRIFDGVSLKRSRKAVDAGYLYSGLGNCGFVCRSGAKLAEIFYRVPEIGLPRVALDLCSGPGGFSQFLVSRGCTVHYVNRDSAVPMTYRSTNLENVTVGDGDLTNSTTLLMQMDNVRDTLYDLVVADGCPPGDARGVISEVDFMPLLRAQIELSLVAIDFGGHYIQKFMFPQSDQVRVLLQDVASRFRKSYLIRPCTVRPASDEFYAVFLGYSDDAIDVDVSSCLTVIAYDQHTALKRVERNLDDLANGRVLSNRQVDLTNLRTALAYTPVAGGRNEKLFSISRDISDFYVADTASLTKGVSRVTELASHAIDTITGSLSFARDKLCDGVVLARDIVKNNTEISIGLGSERSTIYQLPSTHQRTIPECAVSAVAKRSQVPSLKYCHSTLPKRDVNDGRLEVPTVSQPSIYDMVLRQNIGAVAVGDDVESVYYSAVSEASVVDDNDDSDNNILGIPHALPQVDVVSDYQKLMRTVVCSPSTKLTGAIPESSSISVLAGSSSDIVREYISMLDHIVVTEKNNFDTFLQWRELIDIDQFRVLLNNIPGCDIGYGRVVDGQVKFLISPRSVLEYVFCYDGENFSRITDCDGKLVFVSELTEKFFEVEFLRLYRDFKIPTDINLTITQAAAGCGKTTSIINTVRDRSDCVVLAGTLEGRDDIITRLGESSVRVRTIQSYLLNPLKCAELYIDEAMMQHPGMIILAAAVSEARVCRAYGDRCQIPFVNRARQFQVKYSNLADYFPISEHLMVSYRCPVSVAARLHDKYFERTGVGMTSIRDLRGGESVQIINGLEDVPQCGFDIYLCFKQSEKQTLIAHGYTATTVHSFQGKEAKSVAIVRLSTNPQDEIYLREEYALVALTRHRQRLVYFTMCISDALTSLIHYSPPQEFVDRCLTAQAGGDVVYDFSYECPDLDVLNLSVAPSTLTGFKTLTLGAETLSSWKTRVTSQDPTGTYVLDIRRVGNLVPFVNYARRYLSCIFSKTPLSGYAPLTVFNVMNRSGLPSRPYYERELMTVALPAIESPLVPIVPSVADVEQLQLIFNSLFPNCCYVSREFDTIDVHLEEVNLPITGISLNPARDVYKESKYQCLRPKLITTMPARRPTTLRESLYALQKRNCNVPDIAGVVDINKCVSRMLMSVVAVLKPHSFSTIELSTSDITRWLHDQPSEIYELLSEPLGVHEMDLSYYSFMIKRDVKPDLTDRAAYVYSALQTVLSHPKTINVITCPMIRRLKERVLQYLPDNILLYTECTNEEFCERISTVIHPSVARFIRNSLEVDISKYDKSQGFLALVYECKLMRYFGLPEWFVTLWFRGHVSTFFSDPVTGLKGRIAFQRKSGDASTYLGNTMFLLGVLLSTFSYPEIDLLLVSGDDSLILGRDFDVDVDPTDFNFIFNLETKFLKYNSYYFCSKYLVYDAYNWFLVPDPVKVIVKLGRRDLMNWEHLNQYCISYQDTVKVYRNYSIYDKLLFGVSERYRLNMTSVFNFSFLLSSLVALGEPVRFLQLFYTLPGDVLCYDTSIPRLDN